VAGRLSLGPPKTEDSVRQVWLPPFLVDILAEVLEAAADHPRGLLFTAPDGGFLRRSNFHRRVWVPAVNGTPTKGEAIVAGMHFHDLRHTHKTQALSAA
jgi:integrase